MEYEIHEAANITPKMEMDVFNELIESIKTKGQIIPCKLWDGQIVDGRHRYHACKRAGIEPIVEPVDQSKYADAYEYVIEIHKHRDMTKSQRAMMAAKAAEGRGRRPPAKDAEPGTPSPGEDPQICGGNSGGTTASEAAKAMGVSTRSVESAISVRKNAAEEVADAVDKGEITVNAASKLMESVPDKEEQKKAVAGGKKGVKEAIAKQKASDPKKHAMKARAALESARREADEYNAILKPKDFESFEKAYNAAWRICNAWT